MSRKAPIQSCRSRSTIGVIIRNKIREKLVNIQSKCANLTDSLTSSFIRTLLFFVVFCPMWPYCKWVVAAGCCLADTLVGHSSIDFPLLTDTLSPEAVPSDGGPGADIKPAFCQISSFFKEVGPDRAKPQTWNKQPFCFIKVCDM